MPTLSIIRLGNKCSFTYTGQACEITRMLTQCALRDELLAGAITQSSLHLNQNTQQGRKLIESLNHPVGKEIFYFSLMDDNPANEPEI